MNTLQTNKPNGIDAGPALLLATLMGLIFALMSIGISDANGRSGTEISVAAYRELSEIADKSESGSAYLAGVVAAGPIVGDQVYEVRANLRALLEVKDMQTIKTEIVNETTSSRRSPRGVRGGAKVELSPDGYQELAGLAEKSCDGKAYLAGVVANGAITTEQAQRVAGVLGALMARQDVQQAPCV